MLDLEAASSGIRLIRTGARLLEPCRAELLKQILDKPLLSVEGTP